MTSAQTHDRPSAADESDTAPPSDTATLDRAVAEPEPGSAPDRADAAASVPTQRRDSYPATGAGARSEYWLG